MKETGDVHFMNTHTTEPTSSTPAQSPTDPAGTGLFGQDILSVSQFHRARLDYIFGVAREMQVLVERFGSADMLQARF